MFRWRARIGAIVSPSNTVVEGELAQMAPGRIGGLLGPDVIRQTNDGLPRTAKPLNELGVECGRLCPHIRIDGAGPDYDAKLITILEWTVGCPAITTAGAAVAALTQAGTKKLALLAPYPEQMTLFGEGIS